MKAGMKPRVNNVSFHKPAETWSKKRAPRVPQEVRQKFPLMRISEMPWSDSRDSIIAFDSQVQRYGTIDYLHIILQRSSKEDGLPLTQVPGEI
eukprot:scaffold2914_cov178-Amphora_coffeaeformis.AAC.16